MTFGRRLAREMEDRLMTRTEFADAVGVTRVHVSRWVNDHVLPGELNVVRIARVFGVSRRTVESWLGRKPVAA